MIAKKIPKFFLSVARTSRFWLTLAVIGMSSLGFGCAISDYRGYLEHQTQSEAHLWGQEIAFSGTGDAQLDGTYSYTVKYDFRGTGTTIPSTFPSPIDINTYRNPVVGAFSRDGCVDRDGDDIQARAGHIGVGCDPAVPAGKFERQWIFIDRSLGCQFDANFKQAFTQPKVFPPILLCNNSPLEEVDKDLDLQDAFASFDDLLGKIWSGAITGGFTMAVTSVELDGRVIPLSNHFSFPVSANSMRPRNATFDVSTPGGQELIRALLNNTVDEQPVRIALNFDGGMRLALPVVWRIGFDHDVLIQMLH